MSCFIYLQSAIFLKVRGCLNRPTFLLISPCPESEVILQVNYFISVSPTSMLTSATLLNKYDS